MIIASKVYLNIIIFTPETMSNTISSSPELQLQAVSGADD